MRWFLGYFVWVILWFVVFNVVVSVVLFFLNNGNGVMLEGGLCSIINLKFYGVVVGGII